MRSSHTAAAILEAAASCFSVSGYDAVRLRDIAKRANISKGCIYHHYATKEEILVAVVDRHFDSIIAAGDHVSLPSLVRKLTPIIGLDTWLLAMAGRWPQHIRPALNRLDQAATAALGADGPVILAVARGLCATAAATGDPRFAEKAGQRRARSAVELHAEETVSQAITGNARDLRHGGDGRCSCPILPHFGAAMNHPLVCAASMIAEDVPGRALEIGEPLLRAAEALRAGNRPEVLSCVGVVADIAGQLNAALEREKENT